MKYSVVPGQAEGPLIGGNLSLLASLVGTRFMPSLSGAVLDGQVPYKRLVDAAKTPGDWLTYNGGYFGHRHSTLAEAEVAQRGFLRRDDRGGQELRDGRRAELLAGIDLIADIHCRCRIFTDQNDCQARRHTLCTKRSGAFGELLAHGSGQGIAVD